MSGRALVTGGARGLGAAIVRKLVADGLDVDFTYRSSSDAAADLVAELRDIYPDRSVASHAVDLADLAATEVFCHAVERETFSVFVHNAGAAYDALAAVIAQDKAEAVMQVNFWSFTRIAKVLLRDMMRARAGRIIAIGSSAALHGSVGNSAYAASKGALLSYCRTLAAETAKRGIAVNYVAAGFIDTEMLAPYAQMRAELEKQVPIGRFAQPDEVAALVAFLASPSGTYITGAVLPIDGGLTAMLGRHR